MTRDRIKKQIEGSLESDPETVVYASMDRSGSETIFDIEGGNLDNQVKCIGLLVTKVAAQTGKDPHRVASDAAGLADELLDDR